jgi:hypothetical protein
MLTSELTGFVPVTDDPFLAELLGIRASDKTYLGGTAPMAPWLGMEFASAVIPDDALGSQGGETIESSKNAAGDRTYRIAK